MTYQNLKKIKWKSILQYLFASAILFFLVRNLYINWEQLDVHQFKLNLPLLFISSILVVLHFSIAVFGWQLILRELDVKLSFPKCFRIWFYSMMGKYLPGKVWAIVGRAYFAEKEGITKKQTITSMFIEVALGTISAAIVSFASSLFWNNTQFFKKILPLALIIPCGIVLLHPFWLNKTLVPIIKRIKKQEVKFAYKYGNILGFLVLFIISWCVYGIGFYLFACSLQSIGINELPFFIGILPISVIAGLLSLLTPGGLGVREGVLVFLLQFHVPVQFATLLAILTRIWVSIIELICVGVAYRFDVFVSFAWNILKNFQNRS